MIRINLLPIKEQRQRDSAKRFLFVAVLLIVLEVAGLVALYWYRDKQYKSVQDKVAEVEQTLDRIERIESANKDLEKKIEKARQKIGILEKLKKKRRGPFRVIFSLQQILTEPTTERLKVQQRKRNWDATWNPKRLWLDSFAESDGNFKIKGAALSADDVAEFLFRLGTVPHYKKPKLDVIQKEKLQNTERKIVNFTINGNLVYNVEGGA